MQQGLPLFHKEVQHCWFPVTSTNSWKLQWATKNCHLRQQPQKGGITAEWQVCYQILPILNWSWHIKAQSKWKSHLIPEFTLGTVPSTPLNHSTKSSDWEASALIIILYFHSYFSVAPYISHLPDLKTVTIKEFTLKDVTPTDLWDNHKITNYFTHLTTHLIKLLYKQQAGSDLWSKAAKACFSSMSRGQQEGTLYHYAILNAVVA